MRCPNSHHVAGSASYCATCGALLITEESDLLDTPPPTGPMLAPPLIVADKHEPPPHVRHASHRLRRRRTMLLGLGTALVLAAAGLVTRAYHHHGRTVLQPSARRHTLSLVISPQPSIEATTTASNPTASQAPTDTNQMVGYGPVKIGMTASQLASTGAVRAPWSQLTGEPSYGGCWVLQMTNADGTVLFDPQQRAVQGIQFGPKMSTSKNITIGSSVTALRAVYPDLDRSGQTSDSWLVPVTSTVRYYVQADGGKVTDITLAADDQTCFG